MRSIFGFERHRRSQPKIRASRDLDGVLQPDWDLLGERHHEVPVQRSRYTGEGVDPVARPASLLHSGDDRLGGADALGKLTLAEPGSGAQVIDELPEREVLLDSCPGSGVRAGRVFLTSSQRE
ncbi:MAG: hypothetical protein V9G12_08720 [Microthrixaceae bacterium]